MAGNFDSLTDCAVCYERMENPKILPCHHSLCGKCVNKLIQTESDNIKCPMDNTVFNVSDIQNDFRFESFRERLENALKPTERSENAHVS